MHEQLKISGYPLPEIHWTDDVNGQGHVTRKTVQSGETLPVSKLEEKVKTFTSLVVIHFGT